MQVRDILLVVMLFVLPSIMAWRAYRVGYQHGRGDGERRQALRDRYSSPSANKNEY